MVRTLEAMINPVRRNSNGSRIEQNLRLPQGEYPTVGIE